MMDDRATEINAYYSSDEDVAWGPISLREIRREFSKPTRNVVYRRRTVTANYIKDHKIMQTSTETTLSGNAEYCTANETVESDFRSLPEKRIDSQDQMNMKTNNDQVEMDSTTSSTDSNRCSSDSNKYISTPNKISEKYKHFDADIISISSDDEGLCSYHVKSERTNSANFDIICLSSDESEGSLNEDIDIIDLATEEICEEENELSNEKYAMNGISKSLNALNVSNDTLNDSRQLCSPKHSSMNQFIIKGKTPAELMNENNFVKLEKSRNCNSSSNEHHEYHIHNCEASLISSFAKDPSNSENYLTESAVNKKSEGMSKAMFWNMTSNFERSANVSCCSSSGVSENQDCESESDATENSNSSNYVENFATIHSDGGVAAKFLSELSENQSSKNQTYSSSSLTDENRGNESGKSEASGNSNSSNYVENFTCQSSEKNSRIFEKQRNIDSTACREVDNSHVYELNNGESFDYSNYANSSSSEFNANEEELFLNDTFADMENLLENGLNMEDSKSDQEIAQTNSKCSVKIIRSFSHTEQPSSRIPVFLAASNENLDNFKVPANPKNVIKSPYVDKKLPPIQMSPNRFKDIISPVRMYINNSTLPVLKQNHRPIMVENTTVSIREKSISLLKHRNLVKSFPEIIYKPSKQIEERFDSDIILPDNIRQLIKERTVIKHEVRTKVNLNESEISTSEKLSRADLSCVLSDEKNMSVHIAKHGFNF